MILFIKIQYNSRNILLSHSGKIYSFFREIHSNCSIHRSRIEIIKTEFLSQELCGSSLPTSCGSIKSNSNHIYSQIRIVSNRIHFPSSTSAKTPERTPEPSSSGDINHSRKSSTKRCFTIFQSTPMILRRTPAKPISLIKPSHPGHISAS